MAWHRMFALALLVGCTSPSTSDDAPPGRDTGRADAPGADAPGLDTPALDAPPPAGTVPIFIAQGMVGRTTISCDDGRTWIADRSWDAEGDPHLCDTTGAVECYASDCGWRWYDGSCSTSSPCDCGHSGGFAKGVAFGDGWFVATFGWGYPGAVWRSRDGVSWESTLEDDSFGGIAFGAGRFVLASRNPRFGDGATWSEPGLADFRGSDGAEVWSVRRFGHVDYDGGRFVAVASGDMGRDVLVSPDGETWTRPEVVPADCAAGSISNYGGIVSGNGIIVMVDDSATACRSTDGGRTWSTSRLGATEIYSHGVFTGSAFWFWGADGRRYESTDGAAWTSTPMTTPLRIGPVARGDSGTLVATANVWQGYGEQSFLRSTDGGLTWEELAPPAFTPGHAIMEMAFGRGAASTLCPAR